jgi:large subunit ribosomal protein L24
MSLKLKTGDLVRVEIGKDKGKIGKILSFDRKHNRLAVEGVAIVTSHRKRRGFGQNDSGTRKHEAYIDASNVVLMYNNVASKVGYVFVDGDKKTKKRFLKKTKTTF